MTRPASDAAAVCYCSRVVSDASITAVIELLDRRFGLDTLYVFGSAAKGLDRPDSDVDLAALLRGRPDPAVLSEAATDVAERLGRDVDLVLLDAVGPVLAMQVLRHGQLVWDANPRRRANVVIRILTDYADLKRSRAGIEAHLDAWSRDDRP